MGVERFDGTAWVSAGVPLPEPEVQTVTFSQTHSYVIEGAVETTHVFVPFPVAKSASETLNLSGVIRQAGGGSGTFSLRRNAASLSGFAGLTIDANKRISNPGLIPMADGDTLDMVLATGTLSGWMMVAFVFQRTVPVV